jgi:hypothetical protein
VALERELETYKRALPELLHNAGKYVLIYGGLVIGTLISYDKALEEGYRLFGLEPFLVKEIQANESEEYELLKYTLLGFKAATDVSRLLHDAIVHKRKLTVRIVAGTEPCEPDRLGGLGRRLDGSCDIHIRIDK